jgi:protocatechuate 3,4-dioxygenase beta subunit
MAVPFETGGDMRARKLSLALLGVGFFIAPALCLAQQPASPPSASEQNDTLSAIGGTVVSANTGQPLKKAVVVLDPMDPRGDASSQHSLTATTDAAGHFSIDHIPPGRYDLEVDRTDYLESHYGQDQPDKPGATLSLAPGQKMMDLLFRLNRMGIITGRVLDEDGDPVRRANVMVLSHTTVHGKPKIESSASDSTNDLGEYRLVDLEPGNYSILATPPPTNSERGLSQPSNVYLPTYYPSTTESVRASTIEVKSGDEISGIDFVFQPKPPIRTYKIHGHVSNSMTDYPDANISVTLFPRRNAEMSFIAELRQALPDAKTGDFEFKDVVPGEYVATAISFDGSKFRRARQNVDVVATDVDSVSLILTRGIDIAGRMTLEGKSAASLSDVTIWLFSAEEMSFGGQRDAKVQPDGSFALKEIGDGSYELMVRSKCQECYVKSATANDVDVLADGIQITSGAGPAPLAVVYSSNTGTVSGAVTAKDDLPAPGAMVVLIPDATSHLKPNQYKTSTTDQYGRFEIRGVPPGHYNAFAWEKVSDDAYGDPEFLKPLENMAEALDIAANEQKTVQLKMIPAVNSTN